MSTERSQKKSGVIFQKMSGERSMYGWFSPLKMGLAQRLKGESQSANVSTLAHLHYA
jgi:hypothetical protein